MVNRGGQIKMSIYFREKKMRHLEKKEFGNIFGDYSCPKSEDLTPGWLS